MSDFKWCRRYSCIAGNRAQQFLYRYCNDMYNTIFGECTYWCLSLFYFIPVSEGQTDKQTILMSKFKSFSWNAWAITCKRWNLCVKAGLCAVQRLQPHLGSLLSPPSQHQAPSRTHFYPRHHTPGLLPAACHPATSRRVVTSTANRLIGEIVQSRRRPLLGPSPGWKRLLALSHLRHY